MSIVTNAPESFDSHVQDGNKEEKVREIAPFLKLNPPFAIQDAPNAYSFERTRILQIDWGKALTDAGLADDLISARRSALRNYFERAWGIPDQNKMRFELIRENVIELSASWPAYTFTPESIYTTNQYAEINEHQYLFRDQVRARDYRIPPTAIGEPTPLLSGCVLRLPLPQGGERWFQPYVTIGDDVLPASLEQIAKDEQTWDAVWAQITDLMHVFFAVKPSADETKVAQKIKDAAQNGFSAVELVRADAAAIVRQAAVVRNERKLADALDARATDMLTNELPGASMSAIQALMFQFRELAAYKPRAEMISKQLVDAARRLGYHLFEEDTVFPYWDTNGGPHTAPILAGALYKASQQTASWLTYQTVTEQSKSWFRKKSKSYQVAIKNEKAFTFYEEIRPDYDPWTEVAESYTQKGFAVFLFRDTALGLVSAENVPIGNLLESCRDDEEFRRRCVIAIPLYEESIVGDKFLVGYNFFIRPLPELVPGTLPELSVNQMLTYRFTWTGASLGELAATIPLSPGEERTVTISVSQKTERSRSSTATSLTDVTRIDRADFETFFEREVRREKDVTASAETEASGSYGWFSGSAKISGSVSTRDMSRQLNRSVQRASQEVNRRAKEETTVSVSERTESTSSNTTTYKVKNINEGRTLNVSFYRILNSFRSALQLNDFAFSVVGGVEIIAGSGIRERRTFPRDQICDFFDYLFSAAVLPFDSLSSQARQKLAGEIVKQLARQLLDEMEPKKATFATSKPSVAEASLTFDELKALSTQSFAMQKLLPSMNHMAFSQLLAKLSEKDFCEFITNAFATENCELSGLVGRFFEDTSFAYDSGGLYADVMIGQVPATEPYSENMRELEQRKQEAEIRLKHARASLLTSRASRQLLGVAQAIDPRKVYVTERDALYFTDRHVSLRLRLVPAAFFDTGWVVVISSEGRFLQTNTFDGVLYFDLPIRFGAGGVDIGNKPSSWFKANVTIEHPELGLTIGYKEEP